MSANKIIWLQNKELGLFKAYFITVAQLLFTPVKFFTQLEPLDSYSSGFAFYLLTSSTVIIISFLLAIWLFPALPIVFNSLKALYFIVILISLVASGVFVAAACIHPLVLLFKGKGKFITTFTVLSFVSITQLFSFIPVVGWAISFILAAILGSIGFKCLHKLSTVKAIVAYTLVPLLSIILVSALSYQMFLHSSLK